jgi:hypothetical protein
MQLTVAQYQDATNVLGHTIAGTSFQRIEPVPNHDCFRTRSPTKHSQRRQGCRMVT